MEMQLTLDEIKALERKLLQCFAGFCEENGITYFLSNGTLLGAVKYGGFIPWDDDVDVLVPRRDYDRLLKLFCDKNDMVLLARERNLDYRYPFAKLCHMSTILVEENLDDGLTLGVNIDIFPLDAWAGRKGGACRQVRRNRMRTKLLFGTKMVDFVPGERRSAIGSTFRNMAHRICKWIPPGRICDAMMREAVRHQSTAPKYLGCAVWPAYGEREILPADVFASAVTVKFEGKSYPAPAGYDTYLKSLYGDYQKDPPLDEQMTHHRFKVWWRRDDCNGNESK